MNIWPVKSVCLDRVSPVLEAGSLKSLSRRSARSLTFAAGTQELRKDTNAVCLYVYSFLGLFIFEMRSYYVALGVLELCRLGWPYLLASAHECWDSAWLNSCFTTIFVD